MTSEQRADSRIVRRFLSNLKKSEWLGTARQWWPDYVFHFTDIRNAVSILKGGALFSRNEAQKRGLMGTDNASNEIIDNTDAQWKDYVRLYFRPRTPTQYRNEGFRPLEQRWRGAHCPVPIYFLFASKLVLSRAGSFFTDGNLASTPQVFDRASELERILFNHVYHDYSLPNDNTRAQIIFHRQAEVIVQKQMDLSSLRYIVCRSQAEYETFLHLLPASAIRRWGNRIGLSKRNLFFKRWIHVQSVELDNSQIIFHFDGFPSGTFHINASITDTLSHRRFVWENKAFSANKSLPLSLTDIGPLWDYSVRLTLDEHIAYAGRYQEDDLPW